MDPKQTELISAIHAQMVAGDFGETDVYTLCELLRQGERPERRRV